VPSGLARPPRFRVVCVPPFLDGSGGLARRALWRACPRWFVSTPVASWGLKAILFSLLNVPRAACPPQRSGGGKLGATINDCDALWGVEKQQKNLLGFNPRSVGIWKSSEPRSILVWYAPSRRSKRREDAMGRRGRSSLTSETVYFVTTTVVAFGRVFTGPTYCDILIANIKHYQEVYSFRIYGYVIMPSHFHWIIDVEPALGSLSDIMRDIKKYSAWDLMEALQRDGRQALTRLFAAEGSALRKQRRKFWMRRFDDEVIRNGGMLRTKLQYIHNNPVSAGIVENEEDYLCSSARNYILGDHSIIRVETDW